MNVTLVDSQITSRSFRVEKGGKLVLNLAIFASFSDISIKVDVDEEGSFEGAFADFSSGKGKFEILVNLAKGARCDWHGAFLCKGDSQKKINASVTHASPDSESLMSNYGIVEGKSNLVFAGESTIVKGAKSSKTRQEAKIIVFDEGCVGKATPVLRIDENDVSASHAAVVGKLSDAHLFYLRSRGLSLEEARKLLTLGYLKPIENYFEDEALRQRIDAEIEGGV